jgi:hypothetical protein
MTEEFRSLLKKRPFILLRELQRKPKGAAPPKLIIYPIVFEERSVGARLKARISTLSADTWFNHHECY